MSDARSVRATASGGVPPKTSSRSLYTACCATILAFHVLLCMSCSHLERFLRGFGFTQRAHFQTSNRCRVVGLCVDCKWYCDSFSRHFYTASGPPSHQDSSPDASRGSHSVSVPVSSPVVPADGCGCFGCTSRCVSCCVPLSYSRNSSRDSDHDMRGPL